MANMSLGSGSSSTAETPADKSTCAKDNIAAARTSTQKILDCHTFVVSLFTKGMRFSSATGCVSLKTQSEGKKGVSQRQDTGPAHTCYIR